MTVSMAREYSRLNLIGVGHADAHNCVDFVGPENSSHDNTRRPHSLNSGYLMLIDSSPSHDETRRDFLRAMAPPR